MYLPKPDRERINLNLDRVIIVTSPELAYAFTRMSLNFLDVATGQLQDAQLNSILGALERAKLEFTRRVINQNDIHRVRANGDIYQDFNRRRNI